MLCRIYKFSYIYIEYLDFFKTDIFYEQNTENKGDYFSTQVHLQNV